MHAVTADVACRVMRTDRVTAGEPLPAQQAEAKRGTVRRAGQGKARQGRAGQPDADVTDMV